MRHWKWVFSLSSIKDFYEYNRITASIHTLRNDATTSAYVLTIIIEEQKRLNYRLSNNIRQSSTNEEWGTFDPTHRNKTNRNGRQAASISRNDKCFLCGKPSRYKRDCGYKTQLRKQNGAKSDNGHSIAGAVKLTPYNKFRMWSIKRKLHEGMDILVDSRAFEHVVHHPSFLKTFETSTQLTPCWLTEKMSLQASGICFIWSLEQWTSVISIPTLKLILLSCVKSDDLGITATF